MLATLGILGGKLGVGMVGGSACGERHRSVVALECGAQIVKVQLHRPVGVLPVLWVVKTSVTCGVRLGKRPKSPRKRSLRAATGSPQTPRAGTIFNTTCNSAISRLLFSRLSQRTMSFSWITPRYR